MNILDKILKEKEFEVENLKKSYPLEQLQSGIIEKKYDVRSLYNALNNNDSDGRDFRQRQAIQPERHADPQCRAPPQPGSRQMPADRP